MFNHFDSLREVDIGMQAEAHKFTHLGPDYMVRRRYPPGSRQSPSVSVFYTGLCSLAGKVCTVFSGQPNRKRTKRVEKLLCMMGSTTVSLFDNILKGVGRHPKSGKNFRFVQVLRKI